MLRKVVLVAVLLVAGVGLAWYIRGGSGGKGMEPVVFQPNTGASADVRIADLERALAAQIDRSRTLERRLAELEGRVAGRPAGEGGPRRGAGPDDPEFAQRAAEMRGRFGENGTPPDPAALRERQREQQLQRLVAQGFTRDRAEWIERRAQELEVQAMQAQYEAQQTGRPAQGTDVDMALRAELGDADYERYLTANNRPTQVQVLDVLASSNAERSGLQPGDQIVSYAGTRVFEMRELNALTRAGNPGESVTVEIRRNGQTMQVQVPRGPLGVQGGGLRGGPGGGRGPGGPPQGGFRGGGGQRGP